jgi:hypothetical protein
MFFQGTFYDGSPSGRVMARSALRRIGSLWASRPQVELEVDLSSPSRLENRRPFQPQSRLESRQRTRTSQALPQALSRSSGVPFGTSRDDDLGLVSCNPLFRSTYSDDSSEAGQNSDVCQDGHRQAGEAPLSTITAGSHGARQLHLLLRNSTAGLSLPSRRVRFRLS